MHTMSKQEKSGTGGMLTQMAGVTGIAARVFAEEELEGRDHV